MKFLEYRAEKDLDQTIKILKDCFKYGYKKAKIYTTICFR